MKTEALNTLYDEIQLRIKELQKPPILEDNISRIAELTVLSVRIQQLRLQYV